MNTISDQATIRVKQTLDTKPLSPTVSAFRFTRTMGTTSDGVPNWFLGALVDQVSTGIATNQAITDFMEGKSAHIDQNHYLILVPPSCLESAQRFGYVHAIDAVYDQYPDANKDPINAPEDWQLIRDHRGAHVLFDADGNVLPVGLKFNYTLGVISDMNYDIEKMVEYLNKHDQVHATKEGREIEVLDVPYYNASAGSKCCEFIFSPSAEQMKMIWEEAKRLKAKYPSTAVREAVFNLDMLGLRAAGLCKVDNYWG